MVSGQATLYTVLMNLLYQTGVVGRSPVITAEGYVGYTDLGFFGMAHDFVNMTSSEVMTLATPYLLRQKKGFTMNEMEQKAAEEAAETGRKHARLLSAIRADMTDDVVFEIADELAGFKNYNLRSTGNAYMRAFGNVYRELREDAKDVLTKQIEAASIQARKVAHKALPSATLVED